MGYDMTIVWKSAADQKAAAEAEEQFKAACTRRDERLKALSAKDNEVWSRIHHNNLTSDDNKELLAQASPAVHDCLKLQEAVEVAYEEMTSWRGTFRLNIWGMQRCRAVMVVRAMVFDSKWITTDKLDLNEDDYDEFNECVDRTMEAMTPDEMAMARAATPERFRNAVEQHIRYLRGWVSLDGSKNRRHESLDVLPRLGIPLHKLCSNDGWWVTAEECKEALEQHEKYVQEHGTALPTVADTDEDDEENADQAIAWWPAWLTFLARASISNGFRVY